MGTPGTKRRAQAIDRFGGPDVFTEVHLDLPDVAPRQVLVRVAAAAVNPVDLTTRAGLNIPEEVARFPMVLGWDVAGTVAAVGASVTGLPVGTTVAAMSFQPTQQNGTYADHVVLSADLVVEVPEGLPLVRAATVPLAGLTATQLLDLVTLPAGATLVVDGALGAVGAFVVQLAQRRGLRVVAVVRDASDAARLSPGAAQAVTPDALASLAGQADGAVNLVAGALAHQLFAAVRDGGAYATSVPPYIDPAGRFDPGRGITPAVLTVAPNRDQLRELLGLAARAELATPVDSTYPLADADAAQVRVAAGHLHGKVVLVP